MRPLRSPPTLALCALVVGACAPDGPTAPAAPDGEPTTPPAPVTTAYHGAALRSAIEDATTRLVPALGERDAARALHGALARLSAALRGNDTRVLALRLADVDGALAGMEAGAGAGGALAPDLAAIRLTLEATERFLADSGVR